MIVRLAAVIIALAAPVAWLWPVRPVAGFDLDDVQEAVSGTRTVSMTVQQPGSLADGPGVYRMLVKAPSLIRFEMGTSYSIVDAEARRSIAVDHDEKTVMVIENQRAGLAQLPAGFSFYDLIRDLADRPSERIGTRTIDGVEAIGFRIDEPLLPDAPIPTYATVWVDPETRLPVRVETTGKPADGPEFTQVMTDFAFDRELDPGLFSFDVPEGYLVQRIGVPALGPPPGEAERAAFVLEAGEGLGPVRFGDDRARCIEAFGEPDRVVILGERGEQLEYYSRGLSLTVGHDRGLIMIHCFTDHGFAFEVRDFPGRTAEGIAMGADRAVIEAAYGEPAHVHVSTIGESLGEDTPDPDRPTGQVSLRYPGRGLTFTLWEDQLYDIMALPIRPGDGEGPDGP